MEQNKKLSFGKHTVHIPHKHPQPHPHRQEDEKIASHSYTYSILFTNKIYLAFLCLLTGLWQTLAGVVWCGGLGSTEARCGSLPKLTKKWSTVSYHLLSVICDSVFLDRSQMHYLLSSLFCFDGNDQTLKKIWSSFYISSRIFCLIVLGWEIGVMWFHSKIAEFEPHFVCGLPVTASVFLQVVLFSLKGTPDSCTLVQLILQVPVNYEFTFTMCLSSEW